MVQPVVIVFLLAPSLYWTFSTFFLPLILLLTLSNCLLRWVLWSPPYSIYLVLSLQCRLRTQRNGGASGIMPWLSWLSWWGTILIFYGMITASVSEIHLFVPDIIFQITIQSTLMTHTPVSLFYLPPLHLREEYQDTCNPNFASLFLLLYLL